MDLLLPIANPIPPVPVRPDFFSSLVNYINRIKMLQWLKTFPGALNDTGDLPVIKRGKGHFSGV
ncbi:hypothetical protein [Klebsiella variicola]|uniref:hypothetical protein n=1 Tax=Klebsiella variicola TaxID=244366 RepID=UPI001E29F37B|nr:hypothetical protein [Klebsiella variicola]HBX9941005.1 hypothetical protein [Klebsiella variicola]